MYMYDTYTIVMVMTFARPPAQSPQSAGRPEPAGRLPLAHGESY